MKLKGFIVFLSAICLLNTQAAHANVICSQSHSSDATPPSPKRQTKKKTIEIATLEDFGRAMTEGLQLNPDQKELFEIYRAFFFGNPSTKVNGHNLDSVSEVLKKYPELKKPQFREQLINSLVKVYESPESLTKFIKTQIQTAGQFRSNVYQIKANLGFWKKLFNIQEPLPSPELSQEEMKKQQAETNARFLRYLSHVIGEKNQELLLDEKADYTAKISALFKTLEKVVALLEKRGMETKPIRQAMVDLVQSVGYQNQSTLSLLKSTDGLAKVEGLIKVLDERDTLAMQLGFNGHFVELLEKLRIPYSTFTGVPEAQTRKMIEKFQAEVLAGKFEAQTSSQIRVRSLSLQESGFRSCLGGSDCSSRTYFYKALDPNYIYFTMTDPQNKSTGHATVVLGTAKVDGKELKIAFLDKLQNVPNQMIPSFLNAVRNSLKLKKYSLGIPENIGDHNGLSNVDITRHYVGREILPQLKKQATSFQPHPHQYRFKNEYSRADDRLPMKVYENVELPDDTKVTSGQLYQPTLADPTLRKESLISDFLRLKSSPEVEDQIRFVSSYTLVEAISRAGLYRMEDFRDHLLKVIRNRELPFKLRKQALTETWIRFLEPGDSLSVISNFSIAEQKSIAQEIRSWERGADERRMKVAKFVASENLQLAVSLIKDGIFSDLKELFEAGWVDLDLKFTLRHSAESTTFLEFAIQKGRETMVRWMVQQPQVLKQVQDPALNYRILQSAFFNHQFTVAEALLESPAFNVNIRKNPELKIEDDYRTQNSLISEVIYKATLPSNSREQRDHWEVVAIHLIKQPKFKSDKYSEDFRINQTLEAIKEQNVERLKKWTSTPFPLDLRDQFGYSLPLREALKPKPSMPNLPNLEIVKIVLSLPGVDRKVPASQADMLFDAAVALGNREVLQELLRNPNVQANRADPELWRGYDELESHPNNSFINAVANGNIDIVNLLLQFPGIKLTGRGGCGQGAVLSAIQRKDSRMLQRLLDIPGIEVTPEILLSAFKASDEMYQQVIERPLPNINGLIDGRAPFLVRIVKYRDVSPELRRFLAKPKVDINVKDVFGNTALNLALHEIKSRTDSRDDRFKVLDLLLSRPEIDINAIDERGLSPLMIAAWNHNPEALRVILNFPGINFNFRTSREGWTALDIAERHGWDQGAEMIRKAQGGQSNEKR